MPATLALPAQAPASAIHSAELIRGTARRWGKKYTAVGSCVNCQRCRRVHEATGLCSQCTTAETRNVAKLKKALVKLERRPSDVVLTVVRSPAVHRSQMLGAFLHDHYPARSGPENYMQLLGTITLSPMMSEAANALCLAYFGQTESNADLKIASQRAYGRVLTQVKNAVTPAYKHLYKPSEVIVSILIIRLYDNGDESQHDHLAHAFGAAKYLEAAGPSALDPKQPLDVQLMKELHLQTLMPAVAFRQNVIWRKPGWGTFERGEFLTGPRTPWWTSWTSNLSPLAALLQQTDELLSARQTPLSRQKLVTAAVQLATFRETALHWPAETISAAAGAPSSVSVSDTEKFNLQLEEHAFIARHPTPFATHHVFSNPLFAFRDSITWVFSLIADCALLRLLHAHPSILSHLTFSLSDVEASAYALASHLCRSIYSYSSTASMPSLLWTHVFISVAKSFFQEMGGAAEGEEEGWCAGCLGAIRGHVERVRGERRPTLCRVDELTPAFVRAVKFRPGNYD